MSTVGRPGSPQSLSSQSSREGSLSRYEGIRPITEIVNEFLPKLRAEEAARIAADSVPLRREETSPYITDIVNAFFLRTRALATSGKEETKNSATQTTSASQLSARKKPP